MQTHLGPMINIIGAGLAGLSAALQLSRRGEACRLVSLQPSERAQSVLAEGGINAAADLMGEGDSAALHCAETLSAGVDLADPNAVRALTEAAPDIVAMLEGLGVPFQREKGRLVQRAFGGQSKKRTFYARASTGRALMTALIDAASAREAEGLIERWPHHEFLRLMTREGACLGALVRDADTGEQTVLPGPVILCCGGLNGLFAGHTTGTTANTADAAAAVFAQGVEMGNLEFIQYHPTTFAIPGKRCLISEAARGEGGRLYIRRDGEKWYFMEDKYPRLGNLMPRDVVSREMAMALTDPSCEGPVYLDMTGLDAEVWRRRLPDLRDEIRRYLAIDPAKKPVPVEPGIHYFMGGVLVDIHHRTSMPGLWAAGECACQYHGANRLGGNSTLGAIYGGIVAASDAASSPARAYGVAEDAPAPEGPVRPGLIRAVSDTLYGALGIRRDGGRMADALHSLYRLAQVGPCSGPEMRRLLLAEAVLRSALYREESRGAHYRVDFPERDDAQRKTTVASCHFSQVMIRYRDIPAARP